MMRFAIGNLELSMQKELASQKQGSTGKVYSGTAFSIGKECCSARFMNVCFLQRKQTRENSRQGWCHPMISATANSTASPLIRILPFPSGWQWRVPPLREA